METGDNETIKNFFDQDVTKFVSDSFYAVALSFIEHPSTSAFGNSLHYSYQSYEMNFKMNIKEHQLRRLQKYFWTFAHQIEFNNADERKKAIKHTAKFVCESWSLVKPNEQLLIHMNQIINIEPSTAEKNVLGYIRGFLGDLIKNEWFKSVPVFLKIQQRIEAYNQEVPHATDHQ